MDRITKIFGILFLVLALAFLSTPNAFAITELDQATLEKAFQLKEEGNAYLAQKQYKQALQKYQESLALNPDYVPNYYNIGTAYGHLGEKEKSMEYFNKAIALGYDKPRLYYNMAWFYYEWEEYDKAIPIYEKLLQQNPQDLSVIKNLAISYKKAKRFEDAKALSNYGLNIIKEVELAYEQAGRADEVKSMLDNQKRAFFVLLDNMAYDEKYFAEHDDPSLLIEQCEKEKMHCEEAGLIALKAKDNKKAFSYFSVACNKEMHTSCDHAGFIAYKKRDMKSAEDMWQKGCALKDKNACSNLADLFWQQGYKDASYNMYGKACDLGMPKACGVLGDQFVKTDPAKAKQWYAIGCNLGNKESCRREKRVKLK